MENTLNRPTAPIFDKALERSRTKVLNVGYRVVVLKSKLKKRFFLLKRLLIPRNT